jgi:hypothetical protein
MTDGRRRQPASDETPHAVPKHAAVLTAPRQRAMPEPPHLESKEPQRPVVHGHPVISDVSTHHRFEPLALFRDGFVHASLKFGFHLVQLRLQPFANRLPQHRKPSIAPLLHADVRQAEKVERLRFPFSTPLPLVDRIRTELQKSRLLGMQFQVELPHSFGKFRPKLIGIRLAVEAHHDVVSESHDPTHRLRSVRSSLQPFGEFLEIHFQLLAVVPPRLPVHARCRFLLQSKVGHAQRFQVVDVVQERCELQLPILSCCLTYPLQRIRRVFPARCPGRVLLWQVPFGRRVRWWRGSGLRMMPTFPPPPLSFRAAGFPQYGWKVGLSGSAFPRVAQVKPAPGMPCASRRFASALRAPRHPISRPALCQDSGLGGTLPCEELSPLPQRPSFRSGLYCPSPSTLIRPHPSHSQAHPNFAALRFIWNAFAVPVRLGDPRVVPCFRCTFLFDMPSSRTAGSPSVARAQYFTDDTSLRQRSTGAVLPSIPVIRFRRAEGFRGFTGSLSLRPVDLLVPLADLTEFSPSQPGLLLPSFPTGRSPFPRSDMTTVATEQAPPMGLSPIGTPTSIAAKTSSLHPFRHRLPGVVRGLLRYYRAVRLPRSVRHRRTSLDFPTRPKAARALGEPGISRFPCEVLASVRRDSDRAGLWYASRHRCTRWSLPLLLTASASRSEFPTRLNTQPARSPVNAATPPWRAAPHDSGPMWVATSHSCDFCIATPRRF